MQELEEKEEKIVINFNNPTNNIIAYNKLKN